MIVLCFQVKILAIQTHVRIMEHAHMMVQQLLVYVQRDLEENLAIVSIILIGNITFLNVKLCVLTFQHQTTYFVCYKRPF